VNRGELREALYSAGHRYLAKGGHTRANTFLNQGAKDVILDQMWPSRRREVLIDDQDVVLDMGLVRQVLDDEGWPLTPETVENLRERGFVADSTTPSYYAIGDRQILTWPSGGRDLTLIHYSRACWLSQDAATRRLSATVDSDTLVGGELFEETVLLAARLRALEDTDEVDLRNSLQARLDAATTELVDTLIATNVDEHVRIVQTREYY
jgi:hypothetical protein